MTPSSSLHAPANPRAASPRRDVRRVRFAHYASCDEPPAVRDLAGDDAALIEELFALTAATSRLPALAVREIIENLVHADFEGACVSVDGGGGRVRVADCGPGIPDKARALEPGFSTACDHARAVVRGVGSGLPVASAVMCGAGGSLEIDDNLRGGTVVTLSLAGDDGDGAAPGGIGEDARRLLALLVEVAPAHPDVLAAELGLSLGACGRELVLLEHRGLVERASDGRRSLSPAGTDLLTALF